MKETLMPYLLLGYIFTITLLTAFAILSIDKAHSPGDYFTYLAITVVVNVFCFVYSMIWTADIIWKEKEK